MERLGSVDAFLIELQPLRDGLVHIRNVHRVLRQLQLIFRNAIRQCCEDCDTQPVDVNFRELYRSLSGVIRGRFQLSLQFSSRCAISENFSGAREFNSALKLISEKFVDVVDEVHRIADDPASTNAPSTDQHLRSLTAWQNFLPQLLGLEQQLLIIIQGLL